MTKYNVGDFIINPYSGFIFMILDIEKINYRLSYFGAIYSTHPFEQDISLIDNTTLLLENHKWLLEDNECPIQ
jgi:hypothetical protein